MADNKMALALYDFASKQEYIYRTSKIKEISGASALLEGIYRKLIGMLKEKGLPIRYDIKRQFSLDTFKQECQNGSVVGEVLYDGGGNLMVLYKNRSHYVAANRIMSKNLLENTPGLHMVCACVEVACEDGTENFRQTVRNLYDENARRKNSRPAVDQWEVTPMTQIDPQTFLPVTEKREENGEEMSLSADRAVKRAYYDSDDFSMPTGLTAVVYIDGNLMGQRVKHCTNVDSFDEGVAKLREFSANVRHDFLDEPENAIKQCLKEDSAFRRVIGAGDEITFICDAGNALKLVKSYFEALEKSNEGKTDGLNHSCAGIAVIHAKSPFNTAYEIAEAACESAKERSRAEEGNYLDFYYCHAGITNDFETLRKLEQNEKTARPYKLSELFEMIRRLAPKLLMAGRSNVKALGEAAQASKERYGLEVKRVNAYISAKCNEFARNPNSKEVQSILNLLKLTPASDKLKDRLLLTDSDTMQEIYDMYEFFDLWFADESKLVDLM